MAINNHFNVLIKYAAIALLLNNQNVSTLKFGLH